MLVKYLLPTVVAIGLPFSASAIVMDFAGPNMLHDQDALVFSDATTGITATVAAGIHLGADVPFPVATPCGTCIHQHGNGISVKVAWDDSHQLDDDEYLTLTFSRHVSVDAIWFNWGTGWDEFDLAVDGVDLDIDMIFGGSSRDYFIENLPVSDLASSGATDRVANFGANGGALEGSVFTFYTDDFNDDYKIAGLSFQPVAAVPLPAGGLLLLTGLAGLGGLRRLRRTR